MPVAVIRAGKTGTAVAQPLADAASVFRLANGKLVIRLFSEPPAPPTSAPWSAEDAAAVKASVAALAKLAPGAVAILPATRLPRTELPQTFVADLPAGSCTLAKCPFDAATRTRHVPTDGLPKFNGQDRRSMGPNIAGALLEIESVTVDTGANPVVDLVGKSVGLTEVFSAVDASSALAKGADADGFTALGEPFAYDYSGKVLYADSAVTLTLKTGAIEVVPRVKTSIKLDGLSIKESALALRGTMKVDASLKLDVAASLAKSFTKDVDATLYESEVPLPPTVVGGVPVTQALKLTMSARCHLDVSGEAHVTAGGALRETMTLGGRYTSAAGFGTDVAIPSPTLTAVGPTVVATGKTAASCALKARFSILFYGILGPYVGLSSTVSFDGAAVAGPPKSLKWRLDGAVAGSMGVEGAVTLPGLGPVSELLSTALPKGEKELFAKSFVLSQGSVP